MRYAVLIVGFLAVGLATVVATGVYRPGSTSSGPPGSRSVEAIPREEARSGAGRLVLGGRAGDLAVGLAVARRPPDKVWLSATILDPDGRLATGLGVEFSSPAGPTVAGRPCGPGCYRAPAPMASPAGVSVTIKRPRGPVTASFDIPPEWEPAGNTVRRLSETFRSLRSVAYDEHLDSGDGEVLDTRWTMAAPSRLSFAIRNGAEGIAIGSRRWDREPGGEWVESRQTPIMVPEPPWGTRATSASLIGRETIRGRPVSIVSFRSGEGIPIWFTVWVDDETFRPLKLKMVSAAHFMTQRYLSFDRPDQIVPPP